MPSVGSVGSNEKATTVSHQDAKELVQCDTTKSSQQAVDKGRDFLETLPELPGDYNNPIEKVADPFDLGNLRFEEPIYIEEQKKQINLVPRVVQQFVEQMNGLDDKSDKLFVIGIGTGGTIAMSPTGHAGALEPDLDFDEVMEKSDARLPQEFEVLGLDAYGTDSSQLSIDDVGDLAIAMSYIWKNMKGSLKNRFAGFMVVHGTDTMPKSGAHLEMMLGRNMPFNVLHTGAQKPINKKINDAQENIKDGMYMLKMLHANNCAESVTVMGGKALLTAGMKKVSDTHAKAMSTFMHKDILDFGTLPDPDTYVLPDWLRERPANRPFNPLVYRGPNRIGELVAEMQEDKRAVIAAIRYAARKAMLLVTYGASTYDSSMVSLVGDESKKQGIPAFAVSPVNADPNLDLYEAAKTMIDAGVTPLYMTMEVARAKLMAAFARFGENILGIQEFMTDDLLGEIPGKTNRRELNGN